MEAKKTQNIKKMLLNSYVLIIIIMIVPTVYAMIVSRMYTARYNKIIANVNNANYLGKLARNELCTEMWDIVAGLKNFDEGEQYVFLHKIRKDLSKMMEESSPKSFEFLEVATRTEKTLENYINMLGFQISSNYSVAQNEAIIEEIRGVASLLYDILQDYVVSEIGTAAETNLIIKRSFIYLTAIQIAISIFVIGISAYTSFSVSGAIQKSILDMEHLSFRIAGGDLSARAKKPNVKELDHLADNLNIMAEKLQNLIDENIREQKNLKKAEMKTLQAQITPHFLYNTLDSIIWLSESGRAESVIEITRALSHFFRISLSKGHEWITLEQELEHVRSYLIIQKTRYENILCYDIQADEGISNVPVLKLLLQPLVENAIYHGIKNKRGRGHIIVSAKKTSAFGSYNDAIELCVTDDGIGFTAERLQTVVLELNKKTNSEDLKAVYGLYNVNKRLSLYYDNTVSLCITSDYGKGSKVSFIIPVNFSGREMI